MSGPESQPGATPDPKQQPSAPQQPPPPTPPSYPPPGGWMPPPGQAGPPPGAFPPWQPPPPGPWAAPRQRNWVPLVLVIAALLVVVGGAVTAVVLLTGKSSNGKGQTASGTTSSATTATTTTRTTPTQSGSASARLMNLLPAGYDSGTCKPVTPAPDALATADCDQNANEGGPEAARYSLFPDKDTLDQHFDGAVKADEELVSCPGSGTDSPTTWHYKSTPDRVEGHVACGSYKGKPDVVWTKDGDLLLADAQGSDLASLHDWWIQYG